MYPAGAHGLVALPLGARVLTKLRERALHELDRLGAEPLSRPASVSAELHRGHPFGAPPLRVTDERRASHVLSPSHVSVAAELARHELRGSRDLPRSFVSTGPRLDRRGGLHERDTVEVCGFHATAAEASHALREVGDAVVRVLAWAHLGARAHTGAGGSFCVHVPAPEGEELLVCAACGHATAAAEAFTTCRTGGAHDDDGLPEKVHTPGQRSIVEVARFLAVEEARLLKSLVYRAGETTVMVVVRGDHDVSATRLASALGVAEVVLADADEVVRATGAKVGFAGPIGFRGRVLVDTFAAAVRGAVVGANEAEHHVRGVRYGRDFQGEIVDVVRAGAGAPCPSCEGGVLAAERGYMLAWGSTLDPRVTEAWGVTHVDAASPGGGKRATFVVEATLDVSATLAAIVIATARAGNLAWPPQVAPFVVQLVPLGAEPEVLAAAAALAAELTASGTPTLWDDRDDKPGSKLKDAELQGLPLRVALGRRSLATGSAELWIRATGEVRLVPLAEVVSAVQEAQANTA